jgi:uncharacterized protein (UPF0261 family)
LTKTILILGTLDTKGEEITYLKQQIENRGCEAVTIDLSMKERPSIEADINCKDVAEAGGARIEELRASTKRGIQIMADGAIKKAKELQSAGKLHGLVAVGGASNAFMGSAVMKAFPFGLPKLIVTSLAAWRDFAAQCIGTKDIVIFPSVADLGEGLNIMIKDVLSRAAGAICGMVDAASPLPILHTEQPLIALSELATERATKVIKEYLEQRGYHVIAFHGVGGGDTAMEELIEQGFFQGVIDLAPGAISDEVIGGGQRKINPDRLEVAGRRGLPQLIGPCGVEVIMPLRLESVPEYEKRKRIEDDVRAGLRTSAEEIARVADRIAEKLNQAKGPVKFFIPAQGGWCPYSVKGGSIYDPECDHVFVERLKQKLKPEIEVREIDTSANDPEFGLAVAIAFDEMFQTYWKK